jgi:hypothetical protein
MSAERHRPHFVGRSLDGRQVSIERSLDVHDDVAAFGQVHDHIGPQGAILASDVHLLLKVAVRGHAGELDQAPQRNLAPLAADLGFAEGLHQISRLALQGTLRFAHVGEVLAQASEIALPLDLDLAQRLGGARQRLLDRLDERLDRLLAFLQRAVRCLLVTAQVLAREAQEGLDVFLELPPGEVVKAPVELVHGAVDRDRPLCLDRSRTATSHPPAGAEREGNGQQDYQKGSQVEVHFPISSQSSNSLARRSPGLPGGRVFAVAEVAEAGHQRNHARVAGSLHVALASPT